MNRTHRRVAIDQIVRLEKLGRNRIGNTPCRAAIESVFHPTGQFPCGDVGLLALWIDRHDAARSIANHIHDGIRHLQ